MDKKIPGIIDMIPCNSSLLVQFEPRQIDVDTLLEQVWKVVKLPSCTCLDPKYALSVPKYNPPRTHTAAGNRHGRLQYFSVSSGVSRRIPDV